uniref:Uncharacterized protein MANES_13G044400 n=1 Tax=Rhizophora mucronata TaxID=61149 RepID=A0A2P2LGP1_RHIMU
MSRTLPRERRREKRRRYLKEGESVADIVSDRTSGGDSDLVLVYRQLGLRFFNPGVPIHGSLSLSLSRVLDFSRKRK